MSSSRVQIKVSLIGAEGDNKFTQVPYMYNAYLSQDALTVLKAKV